MSLTLFHLKTFGLKPFFHVKGRGGSSVFTKKDQLLNQRFWFLGFIRDVKKIRFSYCIQTNLFVQSKKLTSTNKAFSIDEIFKYQTLHININAWLFSGYSLYFAIYHHAWMLLSKIYWVGLNSRGSRIVVDIVFTKGTVFATMSFHSG